MKFHADKPDTISITAIGEAWVAVGAERHHSSLILTSSGQVQPWDCARFDALQAAHFETLPGLMPEPPELVLFGSGQRLRFAHPSLTKSLINARIGVETMDTAAACRTFNILVAEGRRVVAALIIGD
ncbi:MAG TPA: Mth938-like domain-containing protein [Hydrogenophaga sp.]